MTGHSHTINDATYFVVLGSRAHFSTSGYIPSVPGCKVAAFVGAPTQHLELLDGLRCAHLHAHACRVWCLAAQKNIRVLTAGCGRFLRCCVY